MKKKPYPVTSLTGGENVATDPAYLVDQDSVECEFCRFDKDLLKKDVGKKIFGSPVLGYPLACERFFMTDGTIETILLTTTAVYKWNITFEDWQDISQQISIDNCESGWTAKTYVTASYPAGKVGTNCVKLAYTSSFTTGVLGYKTITSTDLSGTDHAHLWIMSECNMAAGDLQVLLCSDTAGATAVASLNLPAIQANVWTRVSVVIGDPSHCNAIQSVALKQTVNRGANAIYADHIIGVIEYTGGYDDIWSSTTLNDTFVFTNYKDPIQKYDGSSVSDLGGSPPRARYITSFQNRLVCASVEDGGTSYPFRVKWSSVGTIETWTGGTSGYCDLVDTPDWCMGIFLLRDRCFVYKDGSIWELTYVGGTAVFTPKMIHSANGLKATRSLQTIKDKHFFISSDNIYSFDGTYLNPEGNKIFPEIFQTGEKIVSFKYYDRICSLWFEEIGEYWLSLPSIVDETILRLSPDWLSNVTGIILSNPQGSIGTYTLSCDWLIEQPTNITGVTLSSPSSCSLGEFDLSYTISDAISWDVPSYSVQNPGVGSPVEYTDYDAGDGWKYTRPIANVYQFAWTHGITSYWNPGDTPNEFEVKCNDGVNDCLYKDYGADYFTGDLEYNFCVKNLRCYIWSVGYPIIFSFSNIAGGYSASRMAELYGILLEHHNYTDPNYRKLHLYVNGSSVDAIEYTTASTYIPDMYFNFKRVSGITTVTIYEDAAMTIPWSYGVGGKCVLTHTGADTTTYRYLYAYVSQYNAGIQAFSWRLSNLQNMAAKYLSWGGGSDVLVTGDGDYTLTASGGCQITATVDSSELPSGDETDEISLGVTLSWGGGTPIEITEDVNLTLNDGSGNTVDAVIDYEALTPGTSDTLEVTDELLPEDIPEIVYKRHKAGAWTKNPSQFMTCFGHHESAGFEIVPWYAAVGTWDSNKYGSWKRGKLPSSSPTTLIGWWDGQMYEDDRVTSSVDNMKFVTKDFLFEHSHRTSEVRIQYKYGPITVYYSTDSGLTWYSLGDLPYRTNWTEGVKYLNITTQVIRFKIESTSPQVEIKWIEPWYIQRARSKVLTEE